MGTDTRCQRSVRQPCTSSHRPASRSATTNRMSSSTIVELASRTGSASAGAGSAAQPAGPRRAGSPRSAASRLCHPLDLRSVYEADVRGADAGRPGDVDLLAAPADDPAGPVLVVDGDGHRDDGVGGDVRRLAVGHLQSIAARPDRPPERASHLAGRAREQPARERSYEANGCSR